MNHIKHMRNYIHISIHVYDFKLMSHPPTANQLKLTMERKLLSLLWLNNDPQQHTLCIMQL